MSVVVGSSALPDVMGTAVETVLRCEDDVVAILAIGYPFTEPILGLLVLVVVGCVDKVAASIGEGIEKFEASFLLKAPRP